MSRKKYLISGIGPGTGGVGTLMRRLKPLGENCGYKVMFKYAPSSLLRLLYRERKFLKLFYLLLLRYYGGFIFYVRSALLRNTDVIFIHPQTAGFKLLFWLAKNNKVSIYLMDNSFFCIRSYNYNPKRKCECLDCLGVVKNNVLGCEVFPRNKSRDSFISALLRLRKESVNMNFLCQNNNQLLMVKKHFGNNVNCKVVGMYTGELDEWDSSVLLGYTDKSDRSYIVYHGSELEEKGLLYVIKLAALMPDRDFIVPCDENMTVALNVTSNIEFRPMTWSTGLRECVEKAVLVLHPSHWSAPIEGALIKSLAYNPYVASVETKYGFENEIPDEVGLLRLPIDIKAASSILESFIEQRPDFQEYVSYRIKWLNEMKKSSPFD
jgi:glycosyltransferase involved in cell wall biosynthesis